MRIIGFLEDSWGASGFFWVSSDCLGFLGNYWRFPGFSGILKILRDSGEFFRDSRRFSEFVQKVYEVSEVSSPSENTIPAFLWERK